MCKKKAWELTIKIDNLVSSEVWRGQFEQAELFHQELVQKGLTMATIEKKREK